MLDECKTTPYSKILGYTEMESPYAKILSPFSILMICPLPKLLQENGSALLLENGFKILL